jgi:hypothetical protein
MGTSIDQIPEESFGGRSPREEEESIPGGGGISGDPILYEWAGKLTVALIAIML